MGKLRVAQVGVGGMGRAHVAAVRGSSRAELVGVCDVSPEACEAASEGNVPAFNEVRAMLDEVRPDALIAVLPHDLYPDVIELAASRGIHVLKEKPFARNLSDALRMHAAVTQSGIKFLSAAQRQYTLPFQRARELVAEGVLGEIFLVQGTILYCWRLDSTTWSWRGQRERSGGIAVVDSGWHILDAMLWLKGMPSSVYCRIGGLRAASGDYDVDDKAVMAFDFSDGAVGCLTACYLTVPSRFELSLHGTRGTLELSQSKLSLLPRGQGETTVVEDDGGNPIVKQFEHFLEVVLDDAKPRAGIEEALRLQRVVEACYESASTDRRVAL